MDLQFKGTLFNAEGLTKHFLFVYLLVVKIFYLRKCFLFVNVSTGSVLQATGLAALEHSPSVILFEALQKRADDIRDDFSEEQIAALKEAYKKLGYDNYGKKI